MRFFKETLLSVLLTALVFFELKAQCDFSLGPDKYFCQGQTINLILTGPDAYDSYLWSNGSTNQNITVTSAGTYICTAKKSNCIYSDTLIVSVAPLPTITVGGTLTLDCSTPTVIMNASSTTPGVTYNWHGPFGYSVLQNPATNIAGTYKLTITEPLHNCFVTDSVLVNSSSSHLNVSVGGPQVISCTKPNVVISGSSTNAGVKYSWAGPASFNSLFQNPTINQAGTYTLTVTDASGNCSSIATVGVSIDTISPSVSAGGNQQLNCTISSVQLSGNSSTKNVNYQWTGPASQTYTDSVVSVNVPGTYTLSVVNPVNGCSATDTVQVTSTGTAGVASVSVVNVLCNGGNTGSASITISGGTAPFTYLWSNKPTVDSAAIFNLSAGTYSCTITDKNTCVVISTVTISQPDQIILDSIPTITICSGQQTNLSTNASGGTPPYIYNWFDKNSNPISNPYSPTKSNQCMVIATDIKGCSSAPFLFDVNVLTAPTVAINSPAAICSGACVTIKANASGGKGNYTYQWVPGNLTSDSVQLCPNQTTTYTLTLTDECGQANFPFTIPVNPLPRFSILASDTVGCSPMCVSFAGNLKNAYLYSWNTSNNVSSLGPIFNNCFTEGTYTVNLSIKDSLGCCGSAKTTIHSYPVPKAQFSYKSEGQLNSLNSNLNFINTSSGADSYSWDFGDGQESSSTEQNPSFFFTEKEGCYTVSLIASNSHCSDTAQELICIKDVFAIYFPNAFTPNNNDSLNDVWLPIGTGIDERNFYMVIYDRWGNQVFKTDVYGKGWNGIQKVNSGLILEDVYAWKVVVRDKRGAYHEYNGTLTMVK